MTALKFGFKVGFKVMKCGSKILGLLLIVVLMVTPLAAGALAEADHASAPLAGAGGHPASCHAHSGKTLPDSQLPHFPRPAPVGHQCCLTGHDAAAVQASYSPQPSTECTRVLVPIEPALTIRLLTGFKVSRVLSTDPPGTIPLRI